MAEDPKDSKVGKAPTEEPETAPKEKKAKTDVKNKDKKEEVKEKEPKTPKKVTQKKPEKSEKKNPKKSESEKKEKKPKNVMKSALKKKPATTATMKKPAAGGSSSKSQPKAVEPELPEGEEEESVDDDPVSQDCFEVEEARKDRSKWAKFKKLLDQGSLPDFIKQAYQEAQKLKTGKVQAIRQIVNNVLDRDPKNGSLVVNLENPALKCLKVGLGFLYLTCMCTVLVCLCTYEVS